MSLVSKALRTLMSDDVGQLSPKLKMMIAKLDYEIAFSIDQMRKQRLKLQRFAQLEQELQEKIATLDEITQLVSPSEQVQIQNQRTQLQWMLSQIRGHS